jgi:hypothetical protein
MTLTLAINKTNPVENEQLPWHNPKDQEGAKNTIELRVRNAFGDGVGVVKHYFAVYTRADGTQDYIGGFPQSGTPPNGNIKMVHRPYKGGTPDDKANTGSPDFKRYQVVGVISGNPTEVKSQWGRMVQSGKAIHNMGYKYIDAEQNSNSFLVSITENAFNRGGYKLSFRSQLDKARTVIAPGVHRHLSDGIGPKVRPQQPPAHWENPQQQGPTNPGSAPGPNSGGRGSGILRVPPVVDPRNQPRRTKSTDGKEVSEKPKMEPDTQAKYSELMVKIGQLARARTQEIVDDHTYKYDVRSVSTAKTPEGYAKTLAYCANRIMSDGRKSAQGPDFNFERVGTGIKITNASDGKHLATVNYTQQTIAMARPLSHQQAKTLDGIQNSTTAQNNAANSASNQNQRGLGLG